MMFSNRADSDARSPAITLLLSQITRVHSGFFFFSSRRRHTRLQGDWSSDVCSSDLEDDSSIDPGHSLQHGAREIHDASLPQQVMEMVFCTCDCFVAMIWK